jgi:ribonuclease HI
LTTILENNRHQLHKLLFNIGPENMYSGFSLQCSLILGKNIFDFDNKNKIIVLDNLFKKTVYTLEKSPYSDFTHIYTDGSINYKALGGGYAYYIKFPDQSVVQENFTVPSITSSNACELLAVKEALAKSNQQKMVRVYCDSIYVRKGICERILHWKNNNWHTCHGKLVKNINLWQELDALVQNKYVEFVWIKGHNNNPLNDLCHQMAKKASKELTASAIA